MRSIKRDINEDSDTEPLLTQRRSGRSNGMPSSYNLAFDVGSNDIQGNVRPADSTDTATPPHDSGDAVLDKLPLPEGFPVVRALVLSTVILVVYMAASIGAVPLTSQYVLKRMRQQFGADNYTVDTDACTVNKSDPRVQKESDVQARVAELLLDITLASTGPMVIANILLGSYSDVIGRKILFLLPTLAGFVRLAGTAIIIQFELSLNFFYLFNVLEACCGSFTGLLMASLAYTADLTSTEKQRTFVLTLLEVLPAMAGSLTDVIVGFIIRDAGFFYATLLPAALFSITVVIVIFFLPETIRKSPDKGRYHGRKRNVHKYVRYVFDFYVSDGSVRRRVQFCLALLLLFVSLVPLFGRTNVEVLFQVNRPFCWHSDKVGVFAGISVTLRAIGCLFAVHVLQKYAHMSDAAIAAVTLLFGAAANVVEGLATTSTMLYISMVVGMFSQAAIPVFRSILSKMAGASKQGALFASVGVVETVCTFVSNAIYNSVYQATVGTFSGAAFIVMAGIVILNFLLTLVFLWISRGNPLLPEPHPWLDTQDVTVDKERENKDGDS